MIAYLQGTLFEIHSDSCIVLTQAGVGYHLQVPASVLDRLPTSGKEVSFYVHTIVKEDAIELYGFLNKQEQETFSLLVSVSKLGPKTALSMLSTFEPSRLGEIIVNEDHRSLTMVPGIGLKSAKRIVWELKEKFSGSSPSSLYGPVEHTEQNSTYHDALAGLLNLGYREEEVKPVLIEVLKKDPDLLVEEVIRAVLKWMSKV